MQTVSFDFKYSLVHQDCISASKVAESLRSAQTISFVPALDYSTYFLPLDQLKKYTNPLFVLIGIGGSNLGALALIHALSPSSSQAPEFYCADTVDSDHIAALIETMHRAFNNNRHVVLILVSKSGTTLETLANGQVLLTVLQQYKPHDWQQYCLIITDKGSPLWHFGNVHQCLTFEIPSNLGGRFSVFSAVGLVPAYLMGIDIEALIKGATTMENLCKQPDNNPALLTAQALYYHYQNGYIIHDTFIFSTLLATYGAWYRQLLAESIGKRIDRYGSVVNIGITPTISLGTTDLHSIGQLTLAGPKNKYTTFITLEKNAHTIDIPQGILAPQLAHRSLTEIMHACAQGTQEVYQQEQLPFNSVTLPFLNAYTLGALMHYNMYTIVLLSNFFALNAFDQPEVEKYKVRTRKVLKL